MDAMGGGIAGGIFNSLGQALLQRSANEYMESDRNQRQGFEEAMFNRKLAAEDEAMQRRVRDLKAAGLNPMLAYSLGGAGTPSSGSPGGTPVSAPPGGFAPGMQAGAAAASAQANIALAQAQTDKTRAEQGKVESEKQEIDQRVRSDLPAITREQMHQQIRESEEKVRNLLAQTSQQYASAAQARQNIENLRETIPHIRAMVEQAKAYTAKAGAEKDEIVQRVKANLPEIQRLVQELEQKARQMDMPRRGMEQAVNETPFGALRALIRALSGR